MSSKKSDKPICNGLTFEEIMTIESVHYYIQIGNDLLESDNGKISFTKEKADDLFLQVWSSLNSMRESGTREEKAKAYRCLIRFKIHPLRIH